MAYQMLRLMTLWAALYVNALHFGMAHTAILAVLFGMTLKYDYWSNTVELLGSVLVFSGLPWALCLAAGLVLGLGRETLPFLGLLLTPAGVSLAIGSGISTAMVRLKARRDRDPQWAEAERTELQYGYNQWRLNWDLLRGQYVPMFPDVLVYLCIAGLAIASAPALAVPLVLVTATFCRIDEPRVLTMLLPAAASTVLKCL